MLEFRLRTRNVLDQGRRSNLETVFPSAKRGEDLFMRAGLTTEDMLCERASHPREFMGYVSAAAFGGGVVHATAEEHSGRPDNVKLKDRRLVQCSTLNG